MLAGGCLWCVLGGTVSIPYLAHRIKLQSSTSSKTLLSQLAPYSHWVRVPCSDIKIIKMKAKDAHEFMNLPLKHLEKKQRFILFSQTVFFLEGGQLFFQNLPPKTFKVPNSWTNRSENLPRFPPHICVCFPLPRCFAWSIFASSTGCKATRSHSTTLSMERHQPQHHEKTPET